MTPAVSTINERAAFRGIDVVTESGKRALLDLQDEQPRVETLSGDATGIVENIVEVTDELGTGHKLDVVFTPTTASSVSKLVLKADADNDAGEVRTIEAPFSYTVKAEEAAGFTMPTQTTESIV